MNSQEEVSIQQIETKGRRAFAVLSLGDLKMEGNNHSEAFVLYMKGLNLIRSIIQSTLRLQNTTNSVRNCESTVYNDVKVLMK